VTVFIPLLGDVARNRVRFFVPGSDFDEGWLRPLASYEDGESIAGRYRALDVPYEKGAVVVADAATMHQSERRPGAGTRVSIDVNFSLRPAAAAGTSVSRGHLTPADLAGIGRTRLFVFTDSMYEQVDTLGGKRHPTDRHQLIPLGEPFVPGVAAGR
jgi:hypothetical protein